MRKTKDIDKLIRLYFGKKFKPKRRELFFRWFRAAEYHEEKEEAIENIWNEIPITIQNESTPIEWQIIKNKINRHNLKNRQKTVIHYFKPLFKYASILIIFILSSIIVYQNFYKEEVAVELTELFIPQGENKVITLPDGSKVWVDAGSLLIYPKDFKHQKERNIYLIGEANFKVFKNKNKPFKVHAHDITIEALGTQFSVQSYQNSSTTSVVLEQGSVAVSLEGSIVKTLKPNEQLIYNRDNKLFSINNIDCSLYKSKREGYQIYEDISFKELINALERRYNVNIHYINSKYQKDKYTVKFAPNETIEDVLGILHHLIGINYEINSRTIYIK